MTISGPNPGFGPENLGLADPNSAKMGSQFVQLMLVQEHQLHNWEPILA